MIIFLGALAAVIVVLYWAYCRRAALAHQEKLAELMLEYFERDDISEADKDSAYWSYRFARAWLFMPVMAVLSVAAIFVAVVLGRLDADLSNVKKNSARNDIMDAAMQMYMAKNPITFIIFMAASLALIGIILPFGFIFHRLKAMPSPASLYSLIVAKASHSSERHAH